MNYKKSSCPWAVTTLFILAIMAFGCSEKAPRLLFTTVAPSVSGLHFSNTLTLNDSVNILDSEFVYNGAGVALGDLNNDGLDDIVLTGNQVENKVYINKGNLRFTAISEASGVVKPDRQVWSSGVTILDINNDGKQDIYICNTFRNTTDLRKNLLYINQGNNAEGNPTFTQEAEKYGIADTTYSSHAQFFDYDNDGDLDLFIGVNRITGIDPSEFRPAVDDGTSGSRDVLYQNVNNDSLGHPTFVDVSSKANIRYHGYSHSTLIHDFNNDGWQDIYVANDFLSNDLVYINNQDGSFTNHAGDIFKHFSLSAMGSDLADIDNNGELDMVTTEMQPYYNKRKKLFQGPSNYSKEIFTKKYSFEPQYARNTLQQHQGYHPTTGIALFSDISMYAGVQETDWSWAPLFADFDNDGLQDLYVTNGFPKDVTDRDFGDFRMTASRLVSKERLMKAIPEIKLANFFFKNEGESRFTDATSQWSENIATFSNGAAYGDLDNDGDLDLVINNIDDPVTLLQNHTETLFPEHHYLRIKLLDTAPNAQAFGANITVFSKGEIQKKAILSGRGYLSQPEQMAHFGLGNSIQVDSLHIVWPDGTYQHVLSPQIDTTLRITKSSQSLLANSKTTSTTGMQLRSSAAKFLLSYLHKDLDFIDFNFQTTIPHKFSQYGPSLSVGDVNGDGLDDMFISGSREQPQSWFLQQADGTFAQNEVFYKNSSDHQEEDAGTLLFDADNDGDLDLYIARGCGQYPEQHEFYTDVLYLNNGSGAFAASPSALPNIRINSSAVKAVDYDQDGDLDLFVGSRVTPFSYPKAERSYVLRNDSTADAVRFTDATAQVCEALLQPGLISDALWTDFNNDFWPDLVIASEWSPVRFFKNNQGKFTEITQISGVASYSGWWNSLAAADLDNDGDMDYIAGNLGTNTYFKGSEEQPVRLYAKDLDQNGTIDPLISYYLRDSLGTKKEYLYHPWQDVAKQYVGIRKKYNSFGDFGEATLPEMFSDSLLADAQVLALNYNKTSWIENLGDDKFKMHALPLAAQLAPIYGILPQDVDGDSYMDLLLVGNDFGTEVQQGPSDALNGVSLKNTGESKFKTVLLSSSAFYVPGDGKSLVAVNSNNERLLVIASQNNDSLLTFEPQLKAIRLIKLMPEETKVLTEYTNGKTNLKEYYWGSTFQSQSSRAIPITDNIKSLRFYNTKGAETREFKP